MLEPYENSGVPLTGAALKTLGPCDVVWVLFTRYGERAPRIDSPSYLRPAPLGYRGWVLIDGSLINPDDFEDDSPVTLEDELGLTHIYAARINRLCIN